MAINERSSRNRGESMKGFAFEELTVGSATATGTGGTFVLTPATYAPAGGFADRAIIEVSGASMRYLYDGTVPTTAKGLTADDDTTISIEGYHNIKNFQAVRESGSAGAAQPKLIVLYERFDKSSHT